QLLAQPRDDRVDYVPAKVVLEAPHIVQKFYSCNRLTLPCGEITHHVELLSRQNGCAAVYHQSPSPLVQQAVLLGAKLGRRQTREPSIHRPLAHIKRETPITRIGNAHWGLVHDLNI